MRKMSRLRAWIQDSPSSSSSAFVTTSEPRPESKTRGVRRSHSWTSPATPVHSLSKKPVPRPATPIPKSLSRTLSRVFSAPRGQIERQTKEDNMSAGRKERRASTVAGTELANYPAPESSGLDLCGHSELPDARIPKRPYTSPCEFSGSSSKSNLTAWLSQRRRSLDVLNFGISRESSDQPAVDIERPLTRTTTRTTIGSAASNDTDITFAPTTDHWQPPISWAGPSPDEEDKAQISGWLSRKKGPKNSSRIGSMRVYARLNRVRSVKKSKPLLFTEAEEPREKGRSVPQAEPLSSGVVVKIECYEGDGRWHEKPMADIIPKLRELKLK